MQIEGRGSGRGNGTSKDTDGVMGYFNDRLSSQDAMVLGDREHHICCKTAVCWEDRGVWCLSIDVA